MKNITYFTLIAIFLMSASCKQEGFVTTETGLQYMFHTKEKDAETPKLGDILNIRLTYYTASDSMIFDSKKIQDTFLLSMEKPSFMGSVEEGLILMGAGDSITMLVSADSVFDKTLKQPMPEFIEKGSKLRFHVKMFGFQTREEYEAEMDERAQKYIRNDKAAFQKFLVDNNISVEPTESGLIFIEEAPGSGIFIGAGDQVTVEYTGMFLDGTV
ncbi:MAG: hypothetical protein HKN22_04055, partial [Bacteroidia bacterium]|nr:hypothetical protein [Bacteroidia bacterium]